MLARVNGTSLFYEIVDEGKPLLLLHGNGEDHTIFAPLAKKLKHYYQLILVDSRNHGKSEKTTDFSYSTMAEDLRQFIVIQGLQQPNILGFSDGAITALTLAMASSHILGKMALLGINLKPSDFLDENYQYLKDHYAKTNDPLFKLMLEEPNIEVKDTATVINKTLLIAGENDLYRPDLYTQLKETMPNAQLKILAGHSHDSYIVNNDMLFDTVMEFFTS